MLIYLYLSLTFTEVHNSYIIIILKSLALRCLVMKLGYTSFLRVKLRCIESNYLRNTCSLRDIATYVLTQQGCQSFHARQLHAQLVSHCLSQTPSHGPTVSVGCQFKIFETVEECAVKLISSVICSN